MSQTDLAWNSDDELSNASIGSLDRLLIETSVKKEESKESIWEKKENSREEEKGDSNDISGIVENRTSFNEILDELVNKNFPDIFKNTTALARDKEKGQVVEWMVLAGFYKHMVLNELRTLKNEAHYDSDGNDKPESELTEKEDLILQNLVGLPSSKRLRNLTQAQRSIISEIYKTLVFSNYCYGDLLKHCLPIQSVDIEKDHVKKGLKINKVYNKENKKEIFKPPRQLTYGGKIYYFNCHTGIWNQGLNYRCRDYRRCKGSVKLHSIDVFRSVELLKQHEHNWRSGRPGFMDEEDQHEETEAQRKYNYHVELAIAKEKYSNKRLDELFYLLKSHGMKIAHETGWDIITPDRDTFLDKLRRERETIKPKSYWEKAMFNPLVKRTKNREKFLRFSMSFADDNCQRQHVALWISQKQADILTFNSWMIVGIIHKGVPPNFDSILAIFSYDKWERNYVPCWFALMTSSNCKDIYLQIFRYLKMTLKIVPCSIICSLNQTLLSTLKGLYPTTKISICYKSLIVDIFIKFVAKKDLKQEEIEEINYEFFNNINKTFFRDSNVHDAYDLIELKIKSDGNSEKYKEIIEYFHDKLISFEKYLDYEDDIHTSWEPIEEFWKSKLVLEEAKPQESMIVFLKLIQKFEDQVVDIQPEKIVKSEMMKNPQVVDNQIIDITDIDFDYFGIEKPSLKSPNELVDKFEYEKEWIEIARIQKEYAESVLKEFHNTNVPKPQKKRDLKAQDKAFIPSLVKDEHPFASKAEDFLQTINNS